MSESEFEAELRALRPARPSAGLETAIARELERAPRTVAARPSAGIIVRPKPSGFLLLRNLGWALGGAALAAVCFTLYVPGKSGTGAQTAKAAAPTAYFEPVESAREVVSTETSEIFYDGEDGPAQVVRYSSVERHSWSNPATGALVEVEVPREDVFLVPVSYQ